MTRDKLDELALEIAEMAVTAVAGDDLVYARYELLGYERVPVAEIAAKFDVTAETVVGAAKAFILGTQP